jgi:transmembrane sensor
VVFCSSSSLIEQIKILNQTFMDRIHYLIERYLERKETEAELQELMAMIASGDYREIIETGFADALRANLDSSAAEADETLHQQLEEVRRRITLARSAEPGIVSISRRTIWLRIAASILLVAVFSYLFVQYFGGTVPGESTRTARLENYLVSTSDEVTKVLLPDGSIVWLKRNSTLSYPPGFSGDQRQVTLDGEALFEVARDEAHPFVIACGDITTTVLGTSFNIRSGKDNIEVLVLTGKVAVHSTHEKNPVVVLPNEKIVYNAAVNNLTKATAGATEKESTITGTGYNMNFEDTAMDEVVRRIEEKFQVRVTLGNSSLGRCIITADFTGQSLNKTLDLITQALGFHYTIDEKNVIITGDGCE